MLDVISYIWSIWQAAYHVYILYTNPGFADFPSKCKKWSVQWGFPGSLWATSHHVYVLYFQYICIMKCVIKVITSSDMFLEKSLKIPYPDSTVHGANMGPTWVLSAPDGPHVGPMNFAIRVVLIDQNLWESWLWHFCHIVFHLMYVYVNKELELEIDLMTWYGLQTCHPMAGSDLFNSLVPGRSVGCFTNFCEFQNNFMKIYNARNHIYDENFKEISFSSHPSCNEAVAMKFCTWHDSCAVMACAKCCSNIPYNRVTL